MPRARAIVYHQYGSPDVLKLEEVETPAPGDDEVLIKIRAASVNPLDRHYMRGEPYLVRIMAGLRKPKHTRLGVDLAGHVEAAGKNVTRFRPGDEVYGTARGAFAEYVCAPQERLAPKPANLTFEQAAAVPIAGAFTALQGLRDFGQIQPGQQVLINGAGGGVGTFAVQIAKVFRATVTGVCSTGKLDLVRSIGADHVIDYTRQDFTRAGQRYDLIFDCAMTHSLSAVRRVLTPKGIYVIVGGPIHGNWISPLTGLLKALAVSPFVSQKLRLARVKSKPEDLLAMNELMEAKKVTPVIDRCYTLSEVPDAIRYLEAGHARGKIVITLESNGNV